jgi:hypothetical protein
LRLNKFAIPKIFNNHKNIKIIENIGTLTNPLPIANTVAAETSINSDISFESKCNENPVTMYKLSKAAFVSRTANNDTKRTK